jgi:phosphatidylinositol glycan class M
MDDGLLLQGVRYTDVDYDVFTDAANHIAEGRSPYRRHTYRYTPFLAALLSLPIGRKTSSLSSAAALIFSTKYFGKILFCVADALCGYIILVLRVRSRRNNNQRQRINGGKHLLNINLSQEFIDALWWLYNPLPINICTRGSAEALVVLLPVLMTVALTVEMEEHETSPQTTVVSIRLRACLAGVLHGIGVHCKLYPVIYTLSFMANFSFQEQRQRRKTSPNKHQQQCWTHLLSEQMVYFQNCMCCGLQQPSEGGFPWKHPMKIFILGLLWMQRLFLTMSSILFLACSIGTVVLTTYSAVYFYGLEALEEGLLYHFGRIDHRHNYSMYWYWIYLLRGRMADSQEVVALLTWIGNIPLIPQVLSELALFVYTKELAHLFR